MATQDGGGVDIAAMTSFSNPRVVIRFSKCIYWQTADSRKNLRRALNSQKLINWTQFKFKRKPVVESVRTVSVHLPPGRSPQQWVVIITQSVRPSPDVSATRRASSTDRVPLGDVNASSTSPRRLALNVTDTWTCSNDRTTSVLSSQPSVSSEASIAEFGPRFLQITSYRWSNEKNTLISYLYLRSGPNGTFS